MAGLLAHFGSFATWDTCPDSACNRPGVTAIMVVSPTSGVEFGPGIVTAILGAVLVAAGLVSLRRSTRPLGLASLVAGGLIVITCIGFFVRLHVFSEGRFYGPDIGLGQVLVGGAIAMAAGRLISGAVSRERPMPLSLGRGSGATSAGAEGPEPAGRAT